MSARYRRPRVVLTGDIRDLTQGNDNKYSDTHHSGMGPESIHFDTPDSAAPLPVRD